MLKQQKKPKPTGPSSLVITADRSVIGGTQLQEHSCDNLPSYHSINDHSWDAGYWSGGYHSHSPEKQLTRSALHL